MTRRTAIVIALTLLAVASYGCRGTRRPESRPDSGVLPRDAGGRDGAIVFPPDSGRRDTGPSGGRRVFVTSTEYSPVFGGASGGDELCQLSADGAGLGGVWVAWLSSSGADAIDRIADVGPWHDMLGNVIFMNRANLASSPVEPLMLDERGSGTFGFVWTGTSAGGFATGEDCYGWTDPTLYGTVGETSSTTGWTDYSADYCGQSAHLYCFEQ